MSSQFTYEIDERKLRMQLKDLEYPLAENAWTKFESYAAARVIRRNPGTLGTLRLSLNRNVVLPVVFGVVVVSFSIMLFNFISLKPREKHVEQKAEKFDNVAKASPVEAATPGKTQSHSLNTPAPVTNVNILQSEIPNQVSAGGPTVNTPEVSANSGVTEVSNPPSVQTSDAGQQIPGTLVNSEVKNDQEVVTKKRNRKQIDPASQLQEEIRPTVVMDNQAEEDVRPN